MRLSVVIPTYRGGQKLLDCLDTILDQSRPADELIVVDSSDDDSPDLVRARFGDRVTLLHQPERILPGDARNIGVGACTGDVVVFTDDDCLADRNWLAEIEKTYEANPDAQWVGGAVWPADNDDPVSRTDFWVAFNDLLTRCNGRSVLRRAMYNLSFRRDAYLEIGGMPENSLNSDRMFNTAFQRKHSAVTIAPDALILHRCPTDLDRVLTRHKRSGVSFVWGRRRDPSLSGSFGARHRWATPLLRLARETLFWARMWRYVPREACRCLPHAWLIHRVFGAWHAGVRQGFDEESRRDWREYDWGIHNADSTTSDSPPGPR
jgi:glycosyltransferase involved in cell wall biosynthesis